MKMRAELAARRRAPVRLNLAELNVVFDACRDAGAGDRHAGPALGRAARALERVRDKRLRAVQRAEAS
jgi:hypothetical protein